MTTHDNRRREQSTDGAPTPVWWYVIVITPMVASLIAIVITALGIAAVLTATTDLSTYGPAYFALGLMSLPLVVLYPLALYRDSASIAAQNEDCAPNPRRYTAAAILAVGTLFVLSIPLSWYYLHKRRRYLGQP